MPHDIVALPSYRDRSTWTPVGASALTRLLKDRRALEHVKPSFVRQALENSTWKMALEDVSFEEGSALQALFGGYCIDTDDAGRLAMTSEDPKVMNEDEQAIALFLVAGGCSLTLKMPSNMGGADIVDLALGLNANVFLDAHLDKIDWKERSMLGLPWLHYAARQGFSDTVGVLLKHGAQVSSLDKDGNTALHFASNVATVSSLLSAGSDPFAVNHSGITPKSYWSVARKIRGERFERMVGEIGKAKASMSPDAMVDQFIQLSSTSSTSQLEKEIRRLKIKGHERSNGLGVVGAACARAQTQLKVGYGIALTSATAWVKKVCSWPAALNAATPEELGLFAATCIAFEQPYEPVLGEIRSRGLSEGEITKLMCVSCLDLAIGLSGKSKTVSMALIQAALSHPLCLDFATKLGQSLDMGKDTYLPTASALAVSTLARRIPDARFGNDALLASMVKIGLSVSSMSNAECISLRENAQKIAFHCIEQGAKRSESLTETLRDSGSKTNPYANFREQVSSALDAIDLSSSTASVNTIRPRMRM